MTDAAEFLSALARETGGKVADHRVAQALGVADRTVRGWRYREQRVPARLLSDLRRLRAERARRLIAEGRRELAVIIAETVQ